MKKSLLNRIQRCCISIGFLSSLVFPCSSKGQSELPSEINKIIFETSKFNQSIWLELPDESSLSYYKEISQTPDIYESGMPIASITIGKGIEDYDKYLLSFLVKNGYATIETKIQTTHGRYSTDVKSYHFLFYSDDFKKNIQHQNVNDNGENKTKSFIKVAHRKIISIDYKNQYEDSPLGMKRTFYSVVFSYQFVNDLANIPTISKVFKGKGKVFQDPDDGTWKMTGPFENLGVKLDDNGTNEFLTYFRNSYVPFNFEISPTSNPTAQTNTTPIDTGYVGDYIDGKKNGKGKMIYTNGSIYEGEWKDDKRNGRGKFTFKNGAYYDGEWKDDKKNGQGKHIYKDGSSYEGEWKENFMDGYGTVVWANGKKYVGNLVKNQRDGKGIMYRADGTKEYEGDFKNGDLNGYGIGTSSDNEGSYKYAGEFKEGKYDGQGVLTKTISGAVSTCSCEFKNDGIYNGIEITVNPDGSKYLTEYKKGKKGKTKKQD